MWYYVLVGVGVVAVLVTGMWIYITCHIPGVGADPSDFKTK